MSTESASAPPNMTSTIDIGVFIPIANNGWIISKTSPQYKPTFSLNKRIVQKAEHYGLDFALSMVKLRGFGGETEFWDYALESFTLMAGLAAVTDSIKLFASTAVLTLSPAIVARMATTIDSIAPGRFGINIVSGWSEGEYAQMGLWPGNDYFKYRYDYSTEYVQVMRELWTRGESQFSGRHFQMRDCKLKPLPSGRIPLVAAGQSERGMRFAAEHADFNFIMGTGVNSPKAFSPACGSLVAAAAAAGRDVGAYVLFMIIADETDDQAQAKWRSYREGADIDSLSYMGIETGKDKDASGRSMALYVNLPEGAINMNMGTLVGSYAAVAAMLDQIAEVPGTKGIMLTFDDFIIGLDQFGRHIQPLMVSRSARALNHTAS